MLLPKRFKQRLTATRKMQTLDKDSFAVLLWHLAPADAISLRATCRLMNERVTGAQVYWFYASQAEADPATKRVQAHVVPYNVMCVNHFGPDPCTVLLCNEYPEIDADYHRRLALLGPQPAGNPWYDVAAARYYQKRRNIKVDICKEHFAKLIALPEFRCDKSSHLGYVPTTASTAQAFQHEGMNAAGLYIYHYLFACYQREKKRVFTLAKLQPEIREDRIRALRLQIAKKQDEIKAAEHEIFLLKDCESKYEAAKKCPFLRQKPETYQYKRKKK